MRSIAVLLCVFVCSVALVHASGVPAKVVVDQYPDCGSTPTCKVDINNSTEPSTRHPNPDGTLTLNSCHHVPFIGDLCVDITVTPLGSFYEEFTIDITIDRVNVWSANSTIPSASLLPSSLFSLLRRVWD